MESEDTENNGVLSGQCYVKGMKWDCGSAQCRV